ncbi:DUF6615 family protein [Nocardioides sp. WG-D5]
MARPRPRRSGDRLDAYFLLELSRKGGEHIRVAYPAGPESRHGADLELWVRAGALRIGFRLQAKALQPRKSRVLGVYDELDHVIRGTALRQVDVLIGATPSLFNAGYVFYNGLAEKPDFDSGCCRNDDWLTRNGRLGITITTPQHVRAILDGRLRYPKRLQAVLPRSVPLSCIGTCLAGPHPRLGRRLDTLSTDHAARMPGGTGGTPVESAASRCDGRIS